MLGEESPGGDSERFASLGGWPGVLATVVGGHSLSEDEAETVLDQVLSGRATPAQIAGLAVGLRVKGESIGEMTGFVRAMLAHATPLDLPPGMSTVDTCGTGGDRLHSVNASTMAAIITAAAGVKVAKHGGRASSSSVGAADVLEALGVAVDLGPTGVARCITEVGLGFCFAPRFHPAMRFAAPVRRELGVPTVFNYLGPLANPARAASQVVGVSDEHMAEKMLKVLAANGTQRAMVVHAEDGLDEISTTGPTQVHELIRAADKEPVIYQWELTPEELKLAPSSLADLRGGDRETNAEAVRRVLAGDKGPHRDFATVNAAAALMVAGAVDSMEAGLDLARSVIDDGRAAATLADLVRLSREEASAEAAQEATAN